MEIQVGKAYHFANRMYFIEKIENGGVFGYKIDLTKYEIHNGFLFDKRAFINEYLKEIPKPVFLDNMKKIIDIHLYEYEKIKLFKEKK